MISVDIRLNNYDICIDLRPIIARVQVFLLQYDRFLVFQVPPPRRPGGGYYKKNKRRNKLIED